MRLIKIFSGNIWQNLLKLNLLHEPFLKLLPLFFYISILKVCFQRFSVILPVLGQWIYNQFSCLWRPILFGKSYGIEWKQFLRTYFRLVSCQSDRNPLSFFANQRRTRHTGFIKNETFLKRRSSSFLVYTCLLRRQSDRISIKATSSFSLV